MIIKTVMRIKKERSRNFRKINTFLKLNDLKNKLADLTKKQKALKKESLLHTLFPTDLLMNLLVQEQACAQENKRKLRDFIKQQKKIKNLKVITKFIQLAPISYVEVLFLQMELEEKIETLKNLTNQVYQITEIYSNLKDT